MTVEQIVKGIIQLVIIFGGLWLIVAWKGGQIIKVIAGFFVISIAIAMLRGVDLFSIGWTIISAILKFMGFSVKGG